MNNKTVNWILKFIETLLQYYMLACINTTSVDVYKCSKFFTCFPRRVSSSSVMRALAVLSSASARPSERRGADAPSSDSEISPDADPRSLWKNSNCELNQNLQKNGLCGHF